MFFPIRTDRRLRRTPWLNVSLIAVNVLIYLASRGRDVGPYMLDPAAPQLLQYLTYQFLHADHWHLLGNMLFLYVFGNSVEDRLGKLGYLCFYLSGGVIAGFGHVLVEPSRVLGASGSVSAVTGAYLALFPLSNVTIVYFILYLFGAFEVSSMILILFKIGQDLLFHLAGFGGVAYLAHLSGYIHGFGIGMVLLWIGLLPREPYDMLSLIERQRRRAQFRSMTRRGYQPWAGQAAPQPKSGDTEAPPTAQQQRIIDQRRKLSEALAAQDRDASVEHYAALLALDPASVMGQQHQLDLANDLMVRARYDLAARAYELFLSNFDGYDQKEQIELILALIYVRYLDKAERARTLVHAALPRLRDPHQKSLAEQILQEIG